MEGQGSDGRAGQRWKGRAAMEGTQGYAMEGLAKLQQRRPELAARSDCILRLQHRSGGRTGQIKGLGEIPKNVAVELWVALGVLKRVAPLVSDAPCSNPTALLNSTFCQTPKTS